MKATCPNDPKHNNFLTTAHVVEEWVVDRNGEFIKTECCLETTHGPDPDNTWTCLDCGVSAIVER